MCGYSWRVPWSLGTGPLVVVVSQELGDLGLPQGEPVTIDWRWHHFLPGPSYWIFLAVLAALLVVNRRTTARWIIGGLLVTFALWPLL